MLPLRMRRYARNLKYSTMLCNVLSVVLFTRAITVAAGLASVVPQCYLRQLHDDDDYVILSCACLKDTDCLSVS